MKLSKDNIYGLAGTIAFHLIILLILWTMALKTIPPEEEGGILVNFGNLNEAAGLFEPRYTGQTVPQYTPPAPQPRTEAAEEAVTQDMEESIALDNEKKKKEEERRREEERRQREEAENRRRAEEQRKREEAISNRVAGAFGTGSTSEAGQGDAPAGTGNQGSPFGNTDHGASEGTGGYGTFSLQGRTLGAGGLPRPAYTVQEEGRIVINITVDPKGNVIFAEPGRGTNIDNASMRKSAIEAALRTRFNSISGTNNQSGTITYRYSLK
ncbi:MAG: energy transducer TonB [Tannerellaceae bacterium]|jgi:TonB family protein|nr:energy transducer TonB [Tannerellaceae bacterium]